MIFQVKSKSVTFKAENENAIVTIVFGEKYKRIFNKISLGGFIDYGERHNIDIVIVECYLDDSDFAKSRSIAWQKCLILNQEWSKQYKQITWIDADIVINSSAPNILDHCHDPWIFYGCSDKIAIPDNEWLHHHGSFDQIKEQGRSISSIRESNNRKIYLEDGHLITFDKIIQTGVFTASPKYHNSILLRAYNHRSPYLHRWYEQTAISKEVLQAGIHEELPYKFNLLISHTINSYIEMGTGVSKELFIALVAGEMNKAFFLHFCHEQAWEAFDNP